MTVLWIGLIVVAILSLVALVESVNVREKVEELKSRVGKVAWDVPDHKRLLDKLEEGRTLWQVEKNDDIKKLQKVVQEWKDDKAIALFLNQYPPKAQKKLLRIIMQRPSESIEMKSWLYYVEGIATGLGIIRKEK